MSQLLDEGFKCEARVLLSYRLDFVRHRLAQSMGEIDLGSKDARVPWALGFRPAPERLPPHTGLLSSVLGSST